MVEEEKGAALECGDVVTSQDGLDGVEVPLSMPPNPSPRHLHHLF